MPWGEKVVSGYNDWRGSSREKESTEDGPTRRKGCVSRKALHSGIHNKSLKKGHSKTGNLED